MSNDFTIDFSAKPKTGRLAVFSMTISAGIMIDWQHYMPTIDPHRAVWQSAKLQLLLDDDCFFNDRVTVEPITIETTFDDFQDHEITISSTGIEFIPCADDKEHRLGFLIHDIRIEDVSIKKFMDHSVKWHNYNGETYNFPSFIADNGCATIAIKHPLFAWLLDHDSLLR
jgi:hypothetical protein